MAPADKPSAPVAEADVMAALRRIIDPDRGGDIVSLGMVTGLAVRDGHVAFAGQRVLYESGWLPGRTARKVT